MFKALVVLCAAVQIAPAYGPRRLRTGSTLLLLLAFPVQRCFAATICNYEGSVEGNSVAAGSLCSGIWLGDSSRNCQAGGCPLETCQAYLRLTGGAVTGTLPTELGMLTQVEHLWLHENSLSGTIPTELGLMTSLKGLTLDNNLLSGTLPTEFGLMDFSAYLQLNQNVISGTIPSELSSLSPGQSCQPWSATWAAPTATHALYHPWMQAALLDDGAPLSRAPAGHRLHRRPLRCRRRRQRRTAPFSR